MRVLPTARSDRAPGEPRVLPPSTANRVRRALPDSFTAVLFCSTAALFSVVSPLLAHTLALALLVVPHVVFALRYDRGWLTPRVPAGVWWTAALGVVATALLRLAAHQGALAPSAAATAEIAVVIGIIVPTLPRALPRLGLGGAALTGALAALCLATVAAPIDARMMAEGLLWLVPMVLLILRLPPGRRASLISGGLLFFVATPLVIAGGMPAALAEHAATSFPDDTPIGLGPLSAHVPRVFPTAFHEHVRAPDFFRARVYLEYVHSAVVLAVLSALPRAPEASPPLRPTALGVLVASITGAACVALFAEPILTAAVIETTGALQGWFELPLLLAAIGAGAAPPADHRP